MKGKYSYLFVTMFAIVILFNCKENTTQPEIVPPISDPISASISSSISNSTNGNSIVTFSALILNNKSKSVSYQWSCDKGEFLSSVTDPSVSWKAPSLTNTCKINLRAIVGLDTATASYNVQVDGFRVTISNAPIGTVNGYTNIYFVCNVYNAPSQNISYQWISEKGKFITDSTLSIVTWKAPNVTATCQIKLFVTDGIDTVSNIKDVSVNIVPQYELTFGLYDDFDGNGALQTYNGHSIADAGALSSQLWSKDPRGSTNIVSLSNIGNFTISNGSAPSGNVVKIVNDFEKDMRLVLTSQENIDFLDYYSMSFDVLIPSAATANKFGIGLDYHTSIPEQPPGASWFCGIGIMKEPSNVADKPYVFIIFSNKNTSYGFWEVVRSIEFNEWHNLRMDITKTSDGKLSFDFYLDNLFVFNEIPIDSDILIDPSRLLFGPKRNIDLNKETGEGEGIVYIDNVKAIYRNRIE